ncbi:RNA polymerase subunit sigma [Alkalihalobacillus sp. R86527]|uniref:RNA polymerase subunit sigma n=1 Tax=Alkalihalobacillus sp. R86527 TaxID=3093863 RepID=UPI00366FB059
MRINVLLLTFLGAIVLVGCAEDEVTSQKNVEDHDQTTSEVQGNNEPVESEVRKLTLNTAEKEAYENFAEDLNDEHLKGLEPLSIAKLHIYASLEKNYDVHYALYTDKEAYIAWSKEEDNAIPKSHRGTKESILENVAGIQDGEFIQSDDESGYISFENDGGTSGYQMVRDNKGSWKVAFMPIQ